jgi:hypothetical protein
VLNLVFAADGRSLISSGRDQTIRAWDLWNGKSYMRLAGWNGEVHAVALSAPLNIIASGDANQTVRLWDLADGKELAKLKGHRENVYSVACSPDGQFVLSGSGDGTALLWRLKDHVAPPGERESSLTSLDFEGLWKQLAGDEDDPEVSMAIRRLVSAGSQAVQFLQRRLPPVAAKDAERVEELITALDDDTYEVREKASEELMQRAQVAAPALRKKLQGRLPSLEVRRRIERILERLPTEVLERLRAREQRAVHVLERIASAEARDVLNGWASGAAGAPLTRDAKSALERVNAGRPSP